MASVRRTDLGRGLAREEVLVTGEAFGNGHWG